MFHVRQGRRERVPGLPRPDAPRRGAAGRPRCPRAETLLLPPYDPLPRGAHRRGPALRLRRNDCGTSITLMLPGSSPRSMESRASLLAVGILLIIAEATLTRFLGAGVLFVIIGALIWIRED